MIVLQGAEKRFPGAEKAALEALDLTITPGGVTGLVGPDGAGKTTLLRLLAGLLAPSAGICRVAGLDPLRDARNLSSLLGYMPQRFGLYEDLSVSENLELYAALRNLTKEKKQKALARLLGFTNLAPFTGRLAGQLSGGMKQKLGLACTLLGAPKVLLLDEPGVGVDPVSRRELWRLAHELADEGLLIIWSTSYLDEAEQCRDVLLLSQGQLLYRGPPKDLSVGLAGRSFLVQAPDGHKRKFLRSALPLVSDGIIQGGLVRLVSRKNDAPGELARALGLSLEKLIPAPPRFEDAFIDLLGGGTTHGSALADILEAGTPNDGSPVIEARELTRKFGDFTATDQVSFTVRRGEIFGLLGPNGAGKSTTFKMMCGLLTPTSGQAMVLGLDFRKHPAKARERLGYMAQNFSLYGGLSVKQNLSFFSGVYGLAGKTQRARIGEMIETFGFSSLLGASAETLPLGFKQRLALACALMHRPDILFLDEPTSGVDPLTRREFWLHLSGLAEKGVTVMVTTHFMDEAEYCDRLGLVYRGRLIKAGSPDDLKASARTKASPDPSLEEAFIRLIEEYGEAEKEPPLA